MAWPSSRTSPALVRRHVPRRLWPRRRAQLVGGAGTTDEILAGIARHAVEGTRENEVLGFVCVYLPSGSAGPSDAELAFYTALADQAAVAVITARLTAQASQAATSLERARLARELHDSVSQALFSMTMHAPAAQLSMVSAGLVHRIGPANWAMPAWLDRIVPSLSIEAGDDSDGPDGDAPAPGPDDSGEPTDAPRPAPSAGDEPVRVPEPVMTRQSTPRLGFIHEPRELR